LHEEAHKTKKDAALQFLPESTCAGAKRHIRIGVAKQAKPAQQPIPLPDTVQATAELFVLLFFLLETFFNLSPW